ncbi:MAG TPA: phage tail protein, partial [Gemmatimonadaceae bacterium]|nr:phage tail protein [Gemmatimonadaceae bacterium]
IGAASDLPAAVQLWKPPVDVAPDDFVLGYDGILYVALNGSVVMHDLRGRWEDVSLSDASIHASRLAADPDGGAWILDRVAQKLAHVHGAPLQERPFAPYTACTVRPCDENPDPPHLTLLPQATWEGEAVALATSPSGRLGVLVWRVGQDARLHIQGDHSTFDIVVRLQGIQFPYSFAWTSDDAVATRVTRVPREALVYDIADAIDPSARQGVAFDPAVDGFEASGDVYPLRNPIDGSFAHVLALPPRYPVVAGPDDDAPPTVPLHRLSAPAYHDDGEARGSHPFDSGTAGTVWHRLYLEAVLPPHCDCIVYVAATDEAAAPVDTANNEWHEHRFGELPALSDDGRPVPRGAWTAATSEIPYHPGLLGVTLERGRAGLFTALIQRSNRAVRSLRGRYLWVRVVMHGDRRGTPEIAALRAYGSRFSYVERYLPTLYHEQLFGVERDAVVPAAARPATTPADFLERFVDNFEGVLTTLEDRIASSWLLTDPRTTSEDALEWLASWIGVMFDPGYPVLQRRELIAAAPDLFRWRGTLRGLRDALGIATGGRYENGEVVGGSVNGGEIVILENFRLRRTFATILGADLSNENDPLLAGLTVSGNSLVGDTLILGNEHEQDFLALFAPTAIQSTVEASAVAKFFDELAHRVTILVHNEVTPQDLGLVRRIVALETPAHVQSQVLTARFPFMVAVASLVGVDTYLARGRTRKQVDVGVSAIGADFLVSSPSLDPRLGAGGTAPVLGRGTRPVAMARGPKTVGGMVSFPFDASESRAWGDRKITRYSWRRLT